MPTNKSVYFYLCKLTAIKALVSLKERSTMVLSFPPEQSHLSWPGRKVWAHSPFQRVPLTKEQEIKLLSGYILPFIKEGRRYWICNLHLEWQQWFFQGNILANLQGYHNPFLLKIYVKYQTCSKMLYLKKAKVKCFLIISYFGALLLWHRISFSLAQWQM